MERKGRGSRNREEEEDRKEFERPKQEVGGPKGDRSRRQSGLLDFLQRGEALITSASFCLADANDRPHSGKTHGKIIPREIIS